MKLPRFNTKNLRLSPKRLFRSNIPKPDPTSFSYGSSSDGSIADRKPDSVPVAGSVTPTSVLHEISGEWSEPSIGRDEYSQVFQAFKMIDRDGDGVVSRSELEAVLTRLGPDPPCAAEVSLMLAELDRGGDGRISVEDLASLVARTAEGSCSESDMVREAFEFFDADRDGKITAEELHRVFAAIGEERCTLDERRRMIASVGSNGGGFVCFEDFFRMMELQR